MPLHKKYSCKFPKCGNSYYWSKGEANRIVNKRFYRFPKNLDISTKWKMICGIDISINCLNFYICEDHFQKEDFVNFTKHLLKPNVIPKHIEVSSAVCNDLNNNEVNISAICNDLNNKVNINICDTSVNSDTVSDETPADFYDNSMFQNVQVHNSNDDQSGNILKLNSTNADNSENGPICICDNEDCTDRKCTSSNELQVPNVSTIPTKKRKSGFLTQVGVTSKTMSPRKRIMYLIHRKTTAQLSKIKKKLRDERNALAQLKTMSDTNIFHCIEKKLNEVSKHFIKSQLRNVDRTPSGRRWTEEDKAFALSIYKRSPRVYKYLSMYFQLPSSRILKYILSKIPFDTGINKLLLKQLKVKTNEMHELDRYVH